MSNLGQDVRYAGRTLLRAPAFTGAALLTLALGIGATTAIFSVIHAVLLRPLPFAEADRLVFIWSSTDAFPRANLTPGRLVDFREQMTSIAGLAGISHLSVTLTGSGDAERIVASSVSSNFFELLGVRALIGEPFGAGRADDRDVVLGHGLWTRRFGADPAIVGREIVLNGTARRITAIMPASFEWPSVTGSGSSNAGGPELWIPAARRQIPRMGRDDPHEDLSANRNTGYLRAVARLRDGVTVEQAQREADGIARRLASQFPKSDAGRGAVVQPLYDQFFGVIRQPLLVLAAAVTFLLAIACANVASLLLGRAAARRKEIAVRLALGAGPADIARQFVTEAMVLSVAGGAAGVLMAWWGRASLLAIAPDRIVGLEASGVNPAVLAFALLVAMVTGLMCGLIPAWQAAGSLPAAAIADGGTRGSAGRRTTRARDLLVTTQIGVSLVLLIGAGLLLRSFATLARVDTGIDTAHLLTFDLVLSGARAQDASRQAPFYDDVLARIRAMPGVRGAGAAVTLPIGGDDFATTFVAEGRAVMPGREPIAGYQIVTPGYFDAMGIGILAGRDFTLSDSRDRPRVVLVNETLARQQWPGEEAIGRRLRLGRDASNPWIPVVGVVEDVRHLGPAVPPRPELYEVHTQSTFSFMAFVVRTSGDPYSIVPAVRAAVQALDPQQPVSAVGTMDEHVSRSLARPRFLSTLTGVFGALAVILAVVGLYGLMAHAVTQRTPELAIRRALGARRLHLIRLVLVKALGLAAAGVALGTLAAAQLSRLLSGLLHGVEPLDPWTYTVAALLLIGVALAAGALPAARATRVDSTQVLRA